MRKTVAALLLVSALFSCKKTETTNEPTCAVNATTIAGTYKLEGLKYQASSTATVEDQFATMAACQKDDTYAFEADGTIVVNDAGVSCGIPPAPADGWSLDNGNLRLGESVFMIESFNCTKLVCYRSDVNVLGDKETRTYVKQ